ncbi:MAG: hypothetical protein GWO23_02240 [Gammaproteobacteria bacterium]|nr:hypothetical protein [Gammaproteobacteria bacterium]NIS49644.1 hypothetical protein [Phycisphaerae bacterium]
MPNNNLIPLDWDDDAVQLLSLIAPTDEDKAQIWWETYAPVAYQAILDAGLLEDREELPDTEAEFEAWLQRQADEQKEERRRRWWALGILFFFASWRYLSMQDREIPALTIRSILDRTLANARKDFRALCDSLISGGISLADWQVRMSDQIRALHTASAVLAKGGFGRMSPDDYTRLSEKIEEQIRYLDNFARQIANGQQQLNGTLCRRMQLYIEAGRGTYHDIERRLMEDRGFDEYRNILGAAEHCDGCIGETDKGWVAIGELIPIGERECMNNCQCTYEYRMSENDNANTV